MSNDLMAERYGTGKSRFHLGGRTFGMGTVWSIVVGVVFAGVLGWIIVENSSSSTSIKVVSFKVLDEHTVTTDVQVSLADDLDGTVTCTVAAGAIDGGNVGEVTFTPLEGLQSIEIPTDRKATTVDDKGCQVAEK